MSGLKCTRLLMLLKHPASDAVVPIKVVVVEKILPFMQESSLPVILFCFKAS